MEPQALPRAHLVLPADFRPQDVPSIAVDSHLPPVPDAAQSIAALRERFAHKSSWMPAQENMALPAVRAAVLLPILTRPAPTVLLTQRARHLKHHPGQIALPGGRVDAADADAVAAALREAQEEVGLPAHAVEVLGLLPNHLTGTGYAVTPVVALVQPDLPLSPNPGEVEEIFEVPLAFLLDPANHRHHRHAMAGKQRTWMSMPYASEAGIEYFIWGATASILRNLYRFLQEPLRGEAHAS